MKLLVIEIAIIALILFCVAAYAGEPEPEHTGLAEEPLPDINLPPPLHRYVGLDAQGKLPAYLANLCSGHVQEVIEFQDHHFLILCRQATIVVVP